jgi:DNA modification methylase
MNNLELNKIYCESNLETMARMPDGFVDYVLHPPPMYNTGWKIKDCQWFFSQDYNILKN